MEEQTMTQTDVSTETTQAGQVVEQPVQELDNAPADNDITPETSNTEVEGNQVEEGNDVPVDEPKPEVSKEQLEQKLKEYELKEEERKDIARRLGVDENASDELNLYSIEQQVENRANAFFVRMCNDYGVDADPNNMQASLEDLKGKDPAKYYEFIDRARSLNGELQAQRHQLATANFNYNVGKYMQENKQLVESIPAFGKIVNDYCVANQGSPNIYGELNEITSMAIELIRSGIEIGQAHSQQQLAKADTAPVSGGVAVKQTPVYSSEKIWTKDEINRMSVEEFTKHEKAINQAMVEGRIQ